MDEIEKLILRWRRDIARQGVLSQDDVEELEDHLRAAVGVRVASGEAPVAALDAARNEIGAAHELAHEYRKVEPVGWRRWVYAGAALFIASFFLPVTGGLFDDTTFFRGYDALAVALGWEEGMGLGVLSALTNLLIPLAWWRVAKRDDAGIRGLSGVMVAATFLNMWWLTQVEPIDDLMIGYFAWLASFCLTATGLTVRSRQIDQKTEAAVA